jgi:formamidopyrimidine-DNA glycosylase
MLLRGQRLQLNATNGSETASSRLVAKCPNYLKLKPRGAASSRMSWDAELSGCMSTRSDCAGQWMRVSRQRLLAARSVARDDALLLETEAGTLILHLGMSGSLRVLPVVTPRIAHDHVDIELDSGVTLRFNDPRRFGSLLFTVSDPANHPLLKSLAPEPLEDDFDGEYLWKITRRRAVAIKQLIMNSRLVVGVGNIYASEALFRARIRPRRQARSLTRTECAKLARAIKATLAMAVKVGGTTLRDYVGADGNPGYFRQKLYVYERAGAPCRVCGKPVKQFTQGQRSTYWCSNCQK